MHRVFPVFRPLSCLISLFPYQLKGSSHFHSSVFRSAVRRFHGQPPGLSGFLIDRQDGLFRLREQIQLPSPFDQAVILMLCDVQAVSETEGTIRL